MRFTPFDARDQCRSRPLKRQGTMPAWFVTFEVRNVTPKKLRSPRSTRTFESEAEAKIFARTKLAEGVTVYAGTISPHSPRRSIPWSGITYWLEEA